MRNEKLGMRDWKRAALLLVVFFVAMTLNAQESPLPESPATQAEVSTPAASTPHLSEGASPPPQAEAAVSSSATPRLSERASAFQWDSFPWTLGIAAEYGSDTREGAATGYGFVLDRYLFCPQLAVGVRGSLHNDANTVSSTEALLTLRLYAPELKNIERLFFFSQWGFGFAAYREEARDVNTYLLDFTTGFRLHGSRFFDRFYIEPFVRTGFPFAFSGGLVAGRRFDF